MSLVPHRRVAGDRRPPSRGDQQRASIIDAVTELLATVPITKLSVMQIARQAGVTRPVIYFYFESKYSIVAAALDEVWGEFESARSVDQWQDSDTPAEVIVRGMISAAFEIWHEHAALLNACIQARAADPQLAGMWDKFVTETGHQVTASLTTLRQEGKIHPSSDDLPALVDALLGMTLWTLMNESAMDQPPTDRVTDALTAIWLASVWGTPCPVKRRV
jgi:AcrR family transcriptional regulator